MKPKVEENLAKELLWQLALARAEIAELRAITAEIIEKQTGRSHSEIQKRYAEQRKAFAGVVYQKSAKAVGLKDLTSPDHNGEIW